MDRRSVCGSLVVLIGGLAASRLTDAREPLRLVVGFPPGGSTDQTARLLAPQLAEQLGQPVYVDNRPGASGAIAAGLVARAAADGQTLLVAATSFATAPAMDPNLAWDPLRDFTPVATLAVIPIVIAVGSSVEANTLPELISRSRASSAAINVATPGAATLNGLLAAQFVSEEGLAWVTVPYSGGARALQDVLAGHAQVLFANAPEVAPYVRSGQLKALAVTSLRRSFLLPDVPTLAEIGYTRVSGAGWQALLGPAGMARVDVQHLQEALRKAMSSSALASQLQSIGIEVAVSNDEQLSQLIEQDLHRAQRLAKLVGGPTK